MANCNQLTSLPFKGLKMILQVRHNIDISAKIYKRLRLNLACQFLLVTSYHAGIAI